MVLVWRFVFYPGAAQMGGNQVIGPAHFDSFFIHTFPLNDSLLLWVSGGVAALCLLIVSIKLCTSSAVPSCLCVQQKQALFLKRSILWAG